jgi:putative flippase GtrA
MDSRLVSKAPRGSYRRFILVGAFNSLVFYLFWHEFIEAFSNLERGETWAWAIAWTIGSFIAHFTHRHWTFDNRRHIAKTTTGTYLVYILGLLGSTITYDFLILHINSLNLVFLITMAMWGLIDWWLLRKLVFLYSDEEE